MLTNLGKFIKEMLNKRKSLHKFYNPMMGNLDIPKEDFKGSVVEEVMSLIDLEMVEFEGTGYVWILSRECDAYIVSFMEYSIFC